MIKIKIYYDFSVIKDWIIRLLIIKRAYKGHLKWCELNHIPTCTYKQFRQRSNYMVHCAFTVYQSFYKKRKGFGYDFKTLILNK